MFSDNQRRPWWAGRITSSNVKKSGAIEKVIERVIEKSRWSFNEALDTVSEK